MSISLGTNSKLHHILHFITAVSDDTTINYQVRNADANKITIRIFLICSSSEERSRNVMDIPYYYKILYPAIFSVSGYTGEFILCKNKNKTVLKLQYLLEVVMIYRNKSIIIFNK